MLRDIIRQISNGTKERPGVSVGLVDEIGSSGDIEALKYVINCGCKIISTVHGSSMKDISSKPYLDKLIKDNIFERFIVLNNKGKVGNIHGIYNNKEEKLC